MVKILEGVIKNGKLSLEGRLDYPDRTLVQVMIQEKVTGMPSVRGPRLANPADAEKLTMTVLAEEGEHGSV